MSEKGDSDVTTLKVARTGRYMVEDEETLAKVALP